MIIKGYKTKVSREDLYRARYFNRTKAVVHEEAKVAEDAYYTPAIDLLNKLYQQAR